MRKFLFGIALLAISLGTVGTATAQTGGTYQPPPTPTCTENVTTGADGKVADGTGMIIFERYIDRFGVQARVGAATSIPLYEATLTVTYDRVPTLADITEGKTPGWGAVADYLRQAYVPSVDSGVLSPNQQGTLPMHIADVASRATVVGNTIVVDIGHMPAGSSFSANYGPDVLAAELVAKRQVDCPPPPVDLCPNIDGIQSSIPDGLIVDAAGNCVTPPPPPAPVDVCPNIDGVQSSVPDGLIVDANGNCVTPPAPPTEPPAPPAPTPPTAPPAPQPTPPTRTSLSIRKIALTPKPRAGQVMFWRIEVRNRGKVAARNVTICDRLPGVLSLSTTKIRIDLVGQGRKAKTNTRLKMRRGNGCVTVTTIGKGQLVRFTVRTRISANFTGNVRNPATAIAANATRVQASARVRVLPRPKLPVLTGDLPILRVTG